MIDWSNVKSVDDIFRKCEKEIREIEEKSFVRCHYLSTRGELFNYCLIEADGAKFELKSTNRVVNARQSPNLLRRWCMGDYESCIFYMQEESRRKRNSR